MLIFKMFTMKPHLSKTFLFFQICVFFNLVNVFAEETSDSTNLIIGYYYSYNVQITAGDDVYISVDFQNSGTQYLDTVSVGLYLSSDSVVDTSDSLINCQVFTSLYPWTQRYIYHDLYTPDDLPSGKYFIIVKLDNNNRYNEINETDNFAFYPIEIIPKIADLSINSVATSQFSYTNPTLLYRGIKNSLRVGIGNSGNYYIKKVYTRYYLSKDIKVDSSDVFLSENLINNISPYGKDYIQNIEIQDSLNIPDSIFYLLAFIDFPDSIEEKNENNNVFYKPVIISNYDTDVEIMSIKTLTNTLVQNTDFNLTCTFKNHSSLNILNYLYYNLYLSQDTILDPSIDIFLKKDYVYDLYANSSREDQTSIRLLNSLNFGTYYIFCKTDTANTINDINSSNDIIYIPVNIGAAVNDIEISGCNIYQSVFKPSLSFYANLDLKNNGNQQIYNEDITCFLSEDSIKDNGDINIGSDMLYQMLPNSTITKNVFITLPSLLANKDYYLLFIADKDNSLTENNEVNNYRSIKISVDMNPQLQDPELSIEKFSIQMSENNYLRAEGNILSRGDLGNNRNIQLAFYLSTDSIFDKNDLKNRLYGTDLYCTPDNLYSFYNSFSVPESVKPGKYYIIAKIDDYNIFFENNEKNNVSIQPFELSQRAVDLRFDYINLKPVFLKGEKTTITIYYIKEGTIGLISPDINLYLQKDGQNNKSYIGSTHMSSSCQWGCYNEYGITIPDTAAEGLYFLIAVIDTANQIEETDENNNSIVYAIGITKPDIDFTIENLQINNGNTEIYPGKYLYYSLNIHNLGNTKSYPASVGCYLSTDTIFNAETDQLITSNELYEISAGGISYNSNYFYVPENLSPGDYRIFFYADPQNKVTEVNENNNFTSFDFSVYPPYYDLSIEGLTTNEVFITKQQANLYYTIQNSGNSTVYNVTSGAFLSTDSIFDLTDILLSYYPVYSINRYSYDYCYQYVIIPENVDTGEFYILVVADYSSSIAESNETNNIAYKKIRIEEPDIDLGWTELNTSSGELVSNTNFSAYYTINNYGTTNSGEFIVKCFLSVDSVFDPLDDMYLGNKNMYSLFGGSYYSDNFYYLVLPATIKTGDYYLILTADFFDDIPERNEENNTIFCPVHIVESYIDLFFVNPKFSRDRIKPGETLSLSYYIKNSGNIQSNYGEVNHYFSYDSIQGDDIYLNYMYYSYLEPNTQISENYQLSIPGNLSEGKYYVISMLDNYNLSYEKNENNNVSILPFWIENEKDSISNLESSAVNHNILYYPNPVTSELCIENNNDYKNLLVYNITGELIYISEIEPGLNKINMDKYYPGTYFIELRSSEKVEKLKILKIK